MRRLLALIALVALAAAPAVDACEVLCRGSGAQIDCRGPSAPSQAMLGACCCESRIVPPIARARPSGVDRTAPVPLRVAPALPLDATVSPGARSSPPIALYPMAGSSPKAFVRNRALLL